MKVRQNYTLDLNLVQEFKYRIKSQSRSQFVEDSIRAKLHAKDAFNLMDYDDDFLFRFILSRNSKRDGTNSLNPVLFEALKSFIGEIEVSQYHD